MNGVTMLAFISGILIYMAGILTWLLVKVSTIKQTTTLNLIAMAELEKEPDAEESNNTEETK